MNGCRHGTKTGSASAALYGLGGAVLGGMGGAEVGETIYDKTHEGGPADIDELEKREHYSAVGGTVGAITGALVGILLSRDAGIPRLAKGFGSHIFARKRPFRAPKMELDPEERIAMEDGRAWVPKAEKAITPDGGKVDLQVMLEEEYKHLPGGGRRVLEKILEAQDRHDFKFTDSRIVETDKSLIPLREVPPNHPGSDMRDDPVGSAYHQRRLLLLKPYIGRTIISPDYIWAANPSRVGDEMMINGIGSPYEGSGLSSADRTINERNGYLFPGGNLRIETRKSVARGTLSHEARHATLGGQNVWEGIPLSGDVPQYIAKDAEAIQALGSFRHDVSQILGRLPESGELRSLLENKFLVKEDGLEALRAMDPLTTEGSRFVNMMRTLYNRNPQEYEKVLERIEEIELFDQVAKNDPGPVKGALGQILGLA